eukprot:g3212.t1
MANDSVDTIRQASMDIREAMPLEKIEAFLSERSGANAVEISDMKAPDATGVSSGGLFVTAQFDDAQPVRLFLKFDTESAVRPFHIYDLKGQFTVQKVMFDAGLPVPEPLYLDEDGTLLGRAGFVMKVVEGAPGSSKAWVEGALADASDTDREAMLKDAIDQMVAMHAIDVSKPELAFLLEIAEGENSIEREINWTLDLAKYHKFEDPRIDAAAASLMRRQPATHSDVFNHGDNKFDNYLFSAGRVSAIIDFEMVNIAPREMDLAYLLFTTQSLTPPDAPNPGWFPDAAALIAAYEAAGGAKIENFEYFQDVIAFKFSVMVLSYVSNLGLLAQAPEMFAGYWATLEAINKN